MHVYVFFTGSYPGTPFCTVFPCYWVQRSILCIMSCVTFVAFVCLFRFFNTHSCKAMLTITSGTQGRASMCITITFHFPDWFILLTTAHGSIRSLWEYMCQPHNASFLVWCLFLALQNSGPSSDSPNVHGIALMRSWCGVRGVGVSFIPPSFRLSGHA